MVITLDESGCLCTTMFRISPQHLCWALENLTEGNVVNRIQVPDDVKHWSRVALDRMLEIRVGHSVSKLWQNKKRLRWTKRTTCCRY